MAQLRTEPLRTQWLDDAESEAETGVSYIMIFAADGAGELVPAAWAGWTVVDVEGVQTLKCCNNYVRHGFRRRDPDLYGIAYRIRHRNVVRRLRLPAETYLFPEPIGLHIADGWVPDLGPGGSGDSEFGHRWQRLTWSPRAVD